MAAFRALIKDLQALPAEPEYEPDVDERDEKEEREIRCLLHIDGHPRGLCRVGRGFVPRARDPAAWRWAFYAGLY